MPTKKPSAAGKLPREAKLSRSRAAGMAAATRGRAHVITTSRKDDLPARQQIDQQISEMED